MKSVQVKFNVRKDCIDEFIKQTHINVENSRKEPGVCDFLFFQDLKDAHVFYLIEVYNSTDDQLKHREAKHYTTWKKNITPLLEENYNITELNYL